MQAELSCQTSPDSRSCCVSPTRAPVVAQFRWRISPVRGGIFVAPDSKSDFKLRQERHISFASAMSLPTELLISTAC